MALPLPFCSRPLRAALLVGAQAAAAHAALPQPPAARRKKHRSGLSSDTAIRHLTLRMRTDSHAVRRMALTALFLSVIASASPTFGQDDSPARRVFDLTNQ